MHIHLGWKQGGAHTPTGLQDRFPLPTLASPFAKVLMSSSQMHCSRERDRAVAANKEEGGRDRG